MDAREAWSHVEVVHRVDRATADRVVRMVLEQGPPERPQGVAGTAAAERVERLAALEEQPLACGVLLLDPGARGVHPTEDRPVLAGHHLANEDARAAPAARRGARARSP